MKNLLIKDINYNSFKIVIPRELYIDPINLVPVNEFYGIEAEVSWEFYNINKILFGRDFVIFSHASNYGDYSVFTLTKSNNYVHLPERFLKRVKNNFDDRNEYRSFFSYDELQKLGEEILPKLELMFKQVFNKKIYNLYICQKDQFNEIW